MKTNHVPTVSVKLAQQDFLVAKESENLSVNTLNTYKRMTDKFIQYLETQGITDVNQISSSTIRGYFSYLGKQGYTQHTVHDHARPVKTMLRFWHFDDLMESDVMSRVKMPSACKDVQSAFTESEVKTLLQACKTEREKALCMMLLDCGLRASELCALTCADVDVTTGSVTVLHGKGDKRRVVYMGAKSKRALLRYMMLRGDYEDDAPLFPSQTGEFLTASGLYQLLERIGQRCGISETSPHKWRRTCAIFCLRNGMDIFRLAQLLGHEDTTVLRQYLHILDSDLKDAHKQFGALDKIRL